ncbi:hypothetical protein ACNOYE_16040 [Nannocystaceae bacterium ST9]
MTRSRSIPLALSLVLAGTFACKGEEEKPADDKKDAKKAEPLPAPDPEPDVPEMDLSGPKPPEVGAVFFSVDGALLPLACYDATKKELRGGSACASMVAEGTELYMASSFGKKTLDKTGAGTKVSLCGDENALPTAQLDAGGAFDWAVWPKSVAPGVVQIDPKTWSDRGALLSDEEKAKVEAAIAKTSQAKGEFRSRQKASTDIDGDGKDEIFVSAVIAHPTDPDRNLFSALYMAPAGNWDGLILIDRGKKDIDVVRLRGTVDLDGDGKRELWTGIIFEGGAGDRVMKMAEGSKPEILAAWTCGA